MDDVARALLHDSMWSAAGAAVPIAFAGTVSLIAAIVTNCRLAGMARRSLDQRMNTHQVDQIH
jgi:hypothetical protein